MSKPQPPPRPMIHPSTPLQQAMPMINSYFTQVESFYGSLVKHINMTGHPRQCWGTEWAPLEMSDEELSAEIDSGQLSPAGIAKLKQNMRK